MKNNISVSCFLRNIFPGLAILLLAGTAQAATITRIVLDSGGTIALYNASVAVGPDGNYHIVAQGADAVDQTNKATREIYYLRVNPSGTILTPRTKVNTPDATIDGRPKIAVTAGNKAVITYAGQGKALRAVLINPALAPASIIEVAQASIGATTSSGHHNLAIDGNGKAHVIRATGSGLFHIRFNTATLVPDVAEHAITTGSYRQGDPGFAIDSNNRLHVVYQACDVNAQCPAAYAMFDDTGTVRIAPTALFERTGVFAHAAHISLMVESPTAVHVVYGDKRNTSTFGNWSDYKTGGTAFYVKLNPSLDDQNGNAASLAAIRVGTDKTVGNHWYGSAFLSGGTIHFVSGTDQSGTGDLLHRTINPGSGLVSGAAIATAQIGGYALKRQVRGVGSAVVWAEDVYSPTLTGVTTQLVMAKTANLPRLSSGGGGGALGSGLLMVLGVAGLLRSRRRPGIAA